MSPARGSLILFAVAVVPRLLLLSVGPWQDSERAMFGDSYRHRALAANIALHGRFGLAEEEPTRAWYAVYELRRDNGTLPRDSLGLIPESFRTPGYALVVAAFADSRFVLLLQCVLGAVAAVALGRLGRELGLSPRTAFAAGLLWALHPGLVVRDCQFMTESLFYSFGLFGLWSAACGPRGWKGWLLTAAFLGFAGLVRPLGAMYLPAAGFYAFRRAERRWLAAAVVVGGSLLPSVGWMARNSAVGNGFRLSTVGDMTLLYYFAGYSIAEERGQDWGELTKLRGVTDELLGKLKERVKPGDNVYRVMRSLALEELNARPGAAAKVLAKSWVKLYLTHSANELYPLLGWEYRPTNLMSRYVLREETPEQHEVSFGEASSPRRGPG